MYRVRQQFDTPAIADVLGAIQREFSRANLREKVRPGQRVAVAVGSRGIHDLSLIVATVVSCLRELGLNPFILPAMGSHGGPRRPDYRTLIVLDITPQSHGNALGIGMADLTTRMVFDKVDLEVTYTNALTTGIWASVRLPIALENDRVVIETALFKVADPGQVRMARIVNTLKLETFWATAPLLPELRVKSGVIVYDTPISLKFDNKGRLLPFPEEA